MPGLFCFPQPAGPARDGKSDFQTSKPEGKLSPEL
jgi:hypothetical protein